MEQEAAKTGKCKVRRLFNRMMSQKADKPVDVFSRCSCKVYLWVP